MAQISNDISFVTFGMFIIDEIEWQTPNPPPPKTNLIGGAGTYAVLGARLAASPSQSLSRTISWIVDIGSDFPPEVKATIDTWKTDCVFRHDSNRLTTRAWNGYGANDLRAFKYLTPKVRLEVSSLNPAQIMAKSFHMVCSPDRCIDITTKLREARQAIDPTSQDPVVIWEPIPDLCSPEELHRLQEAARNCTIISPNHEELKMFFPTEITSAETQEQLVKRLMGWDIQEYASQGQQSSYQSSLPFSYPAVIIREGRNGSTAYFYPHHVHHPSSELLTVHLPAYHTPSTSSRVIDPTGGGNTYLGALALTLGLLSTKLPIDFPLHNVLARYISTATDSQPTPNTTRRHPLHKVLGSTPDQHSAVPIMHAMVLALIAASFAIEQNGTPTLTVTHGRNGENHLDDEIWNGETVEQRVIKYLEREWGV